MAVFQFNGYDLNDYFKLIKVSHEIGNERNITTDSAPKIGVNIQQVAFGAKKSSLLSAWRQDILKILLS